LQKRTKRTKATKRMQWLAPRVGYPDGPRLQNSPLYFPSGALGLQRLAQLSSGFLRNVDGVPIPYNPYLGLCSTDNLQQVVPNPLLRGYVGHLGAVATAPRVYV
jgi:hypothetical protein